MPDLGRLAQSASDLSVPLRLHYSIKLQGNKLVPVGKILLGVPGPWDPWCSWLVQQDPGGLLGFGLFNVHMFADHR